MRIVMHRGPDRLELDVPEDRLLVRPPELPAPLADPADAVRTALESPLDYPPLRRGLTPDDRVAIVIDEQLPEVGGLLVPILEHIASAGVATTSVTLVCPPGPSRQPWVEGLPDEFEDVTVEVHNPADRKKLAYLASMRQGKRLYLNRTVVDADCVVVLTGRRYDVLLGHGGGEGTLYPALSDEETRTETSGRLHLEAPGAVPWQTRAEAIEATWLLGAPFFVQAIEGAGGLQQIVAGGASSCAAGQRLLDERWRLEVPRAADLVVAGLSGDPAGHTFEDLAAAVSTASRVVQPGGRIALLTGARPDLGPADVLLAADDAAEVFAKLRRHPTLEQLAALRWAEAASRARLYVLSGLDGQTAEDLFATPLEHADQVRRLIDQERSCLLLEDAHKTLAVVAS